MEHETKNSPWIVVLTVIKYSITAVISYLAGSSDVVTNLLNS